MNDIEKITKLYNDCYMSRKAYDEIILIIELQKTYINHLLEKDKEYRILLGEIGDGDIKRSYNLYDFNYI